MKADGGRGVKGLISTDRKFRSLGAALLAHFPLLIACHQRTLKPLKVPRNRYCFLAAKGTTLGRNGLLDAFSAIIWIIEGLKRGSAEDNTHSDKVMVLGLNHISQALKIS